MTNINNQNFYFIIFLFLKLLKFQHIVFSYNLRNISLKFKEVCLKNEGGDKFLVTF